MSPSILEALLYGAGNAGIPSSHWILQLLDLFLDEPLLTSDFP